jgi:hypothetical protein
LLAEYADGLMEEGYHEWREIAPAFLKTIVKEDPRKAQFKALKQFLKRIMGPILRRLGLI